MPKRYSARRGGRAGSRYGRKRTARATSYLRRRPWWSSKKRIVTFRRMPVYRFTRQNTTSITAAGINAALGAYGQAFQLSDVPNVSEFTALFDQYRITRVKVTVRPNYDSHTLADTGIASRVPVFTAIDFDNINVPTITQASMEQKDTCMTHTLDDIIVREFTPQPAAEYYNLPLGAFGPPGRSAWIDSSNDGVPHYGFKMFFYGGGVPNDYAAAITVEYALEFKNVQ